jgi:hypothetical protein
VDPYGRSGPEILEHSPRQWRVPGPRWLPVLVAALVLAGGIGALLAAGLGSAGGTHHTRNAAAAGLCRSSARPVGHAVHVLPQSGAITYCTVSLTPRANSGRSRVRQPAICLPVPDHARQAGVHRRCFHSLA